ncbi:hypothetical protein L2E81_24685 [Planktothrix agardhii 1033]|nr:hypothetical protein [Planktothrix agardhii 1033]
MNVKNVNNLGGFSSKFLEIPKKIRIKQRPVEENLLGRKEILELPKCCIALESCQKPCEKWPKHYQVKFKMTESKKTSDLCYIWYINADENFSIVVASRSNPSRPVKDFEDIWNLC